MPSSKGKKQRLNEIKRDLIAKNKINKCGDCIHFFNGFCQIHKRKEYAISHACKSYSK